MCSKGGARIADLGVQIWAIYRKTKAKKDVMLKPIQQKSAPPPRKAGLEPRTRACRVRRNDMSEVLLNTPAGFYARVSKRVPVCQNTSRYENIRGYFGHHPTRQAGIPVASIPAGHPARVFS